MDLDLGLMTFISPSADRLSIGPEKRPEASLWAKTQPDASQISRILNG